MRNLLGRGPLEAKLSVACAASPAGHWYFRGLLRVRPLLLRGLPWLGQASDSLKRLRHDQSNG